MVNMNLSKTKIGAVVVGVAALLATIGGYVSGTISPAVSIYQAVGEIGAVLAVFGLRDAITSNTNTIATAIAAATTPTA